MPDVSSPVAATRGLSPVDPGVRPAMNHVEHAINRAYRELVETREPRDVLRVLCEGIASALGVALVALVQRHDGGTLEVEAASDETLLWAELTRMPERWDGTMAGNGPASRALRSGATVSITLDDAGFVLWRTAARRDGLAEVCAVPLITRNPDWVLLLCSDATTDARTDHTAEIAAASAGCARLIDSMDRVTRERMLATAVTEAGNAAFTADAQGRVTWCNASFAQLTGQSPDDAVGRRPRFLDPDRHDVPHYRELWETLRAGRVWRGETVDRDRAGAAFTARQTISPFGAPGAVHYLVIYHDLGERTNRTQPRAASAVAARDISLTQQAALENHLTATLSRGRPVRIARVVARGLPALSTLGKEVLTALGSTMHARIRSLFGAEHAASTAPGEFLIKLPDDDGHAERLIAAVCKGLAAPYPMIGAAPALDLRIGLAQAPRDGASLDTLLRAADRALDRTPLMTA